jgi:hypothetical protein
VSVYIPTFAQRQHGRPRPRVVCVQGARAATARLPCPCFARTRTPYPPSLSPPPSPCLVARLRGACSPQRALHLAQQQPPVPLRSPPPGQVTVCACALACVCAPALARIWCALPVFFFLPVIWFLFRVVPRARLYQSISRYNTTSIQLRATVRGQRRRPPPQPRR